MRRGWHPDLVTDQTSAHDPLGGYVPGGIGLEEARELRERDPADYTAALHGLHGRARAGDARLPGIGLGRLRLRQQHPRTAREAGVENAFDFPGFVPAFIRPLFCEGKGPFRWAALSGDPETS